jgi:hypothetical protein
MYSIPHGGDPPRLASVAASNGAGSGNVVLNRRVFRGRVVNRADRRSLPCNQGIILGRDCMPITPYLDGFDHDSETKQVVGVALEMTRIALGLTDVCPTASSPSKS